MRLSLERTDSSFISSCDVATDRNELAGSAAPDRTASSRCTVFLVCGSLRLARTRQCCPSQSFDSRTLEIKPVNVCARQLNANPPQTSSTKQAQDSLPRTSDGNVTQPQSLWAITGRGHANRNSVQMTIGTCMWSKTTVSSTAM